MADKILGPFIEAREDSHNFAGLLDMLESIKRNKEDVLGMSLSTETKQKCVDDFDNQIRTVKERMHKAIDAM